MAKFFGTVGYLIEEETRPDIYEPKIIERHYFGDVMKRSRRLQSTDKINDDVILSVEISIVADEFANENIMNICWVEYCGAKWKATVVEKSYPRITLSLGGLYNEKPTA